MDIQQIVATVAPIAANVIVSVVLPFAIKKITLRKLDKKINEETSQQTKELKEIKKEILEMRGKIKWKKDRYFIR